MKKISLLNVFLPCITFPSVNTIFKLAIFRPLHSLSILSYLLCLPHLIFYFTKHILGAQISYFSPFFFCA